MITSLVQQGHSSSKLTFPSSPTSVIPTYIQRNANLLCNSWDETSLFPVPI